MALSTPVFDRAAALPVFQHHVHFGTAVVDRQQAGAVSERLLMDAVERALRAPKGRVAMVLHLSRLKIPQPRLYHPRIALALLMDTAQRLGGQVFAMRNTDLVLLCAAPEEDPRPGRPSPAPFNLPQALERLFGFDAPDAVLTSIWRLDEQPGAFRDYLSERQEDPAAPDRRAEDSVQAATLGPLMARLAGIDLRQILIQQTAAALHPGDGLPLGARLRPLYREVLLAPVPPQAAAGQAAPLSDPFIHRHVAGMLDGRVLTHLAEDLRAQGTLTRPALLLGIPLHLNLSPEAIVSPGFARLAQLAQARGARFAVEMMAMDAAADPALTVFARALLAQVGFALVLDGIDHAGLTMIDTAALAPHLVKLTWSSRLADGPRSLLGPIDAAIAAIDPARMVLAEADGEAALAWAESRGITRFQGPYIDAVEAASRIAICHSARACTLRQCTGRAQSLNPGPRAGCGNPGLLDMPIQTVAAQAAA
jgi:hypothetical protein